MNQTGLPVCFVILYHYKQRAVTAVPTNEPDWITWMASSHCIITNSELLQPYLQMNQTGLPGWPRPIVSLQTASCYSRTYKWTRLDYLDGLVPLYHYKQRAVTAVPTNEPDWITWMASSHCIITNSELLQPYLQMNQTGLPGWPRPIVSLQTASCYSRTYKWTRLDYLDGLVPLYHYKQRAVTAVPTNEPDWITWMASSHCIITNSELLPYLQMNQTGLPGWPRPIVSLRTASCYSRTYKWTRLDYLDGLVPLYHYGQRTVRAARTNEPDWITSKPRYTVSLQTASS